MRRYFYQLLDEQNNDLGVFLPDGSHKQSAVNRAKVWMKENNVQEATLSVNSLATCNILDMILITIK